MVIEEGRTRLVEVIRWKYAWSGGTVAWNFRINGVAFHRKVYSDGSYRMFRGAISAYRRNEIGGEPLVLVEANPGCSYTREASTPHLVDQYLDNYIAVVAVSGGDFQQRFQAVRVYYRSGDGEVIPTGVETSLFP